MSSTRHPIPARPFQEFLRPAITAILFTTMATWDLPGILIAIDWILILLMLFRGFRSGLPTPSPEPPRLIPARSVLIGLCLLLLTGLLARTLQLHSFIPWPTGDESENLLISWLWSAEGWNGRFFHGFAQHPPAFHGLLAAWFSLFGVGLESMRSLQVVLSFTCLPLTFLAVRPFAGSRAALIATTFMAFGIWPLLISRFCLAVVPFILLFTASWALLGAHTRETSASRRKGFAWAIGIAWSLGFLTYAIWPGIVAGFGVLAWALALGRPDRRENLIRMFLGSLPGGFLFGFAAWKEGFGGHIRNKILFTDPQAMTETLLNIPNYLRTLLTGIPGRITDYGPLWGGLLNPWVAAFFLEGVLLFLMARRHRVLGLGLIGLYLAPGILARGIEPFRILPAFLLALGLAAWGLDRLLARGLSARNGLIVLALVLTVSSATDLVQLFGPYRAATNRWDSRVGHMRKEGSYNAWKILEERSATQGPGRLFLNLGFQPADPTLYLKTRRFVEPCASNTPVRWIALLVDAHYAPFLKERWKNVRFHPLVQPMDSTNATLLAVLPTPSGGFAGLTELCDADRILGDRELRQQIRANGSSNQEEIDVLTDLQRRVRDPLLVSVLADKIQILVFWERERIGSDPEFRLRTIANQIVEDALGRGYPAAHLLFLRGEFLAHRGRIREAREAWKKAVSSPVDFTPARERLAELEKDGKDQATGATTPERR